MLTLTTFGGALDEPSLSPFCTKAMIVLSLSGREWRPKVAMDSRKAPFGTYPVLETPEGQIGDSNLMLDYLEAQGVDLFPGLDGPGRANAHAAIRMVEENLRYGMVYDRWVDEQSWRDFKPMVFGKLPAPLKMIIPGMVRGSIVKGLKWQGLGKFGPAERLSYMQADLAALTGMLEGHDWLLGDQPTTADAAILPVLSGIDRLLVDSGLRSAVRSNETLMAYVARGRETLYAPVQAALDAARAAKA